MILWVARALQGMCQRVVIEAPADSEYCALGFEMVAARAEDAGKGPLAGIAAGLGCGGDGEFVAFAPCDMPLLTAGVFHRLSAVKGAACAETAAGLEPLVCVLPAAARTFIADELDKSPILAVKEVLKRAGVVSVFFEDAAQFANANTVAELQELEARARAQR